MIQRDGKIVAAGSARNGSFANEFALVRLNPQLSTTDTVPDGAVCGALQCVLRGLVNSWPLREPFRRWRELTDRKVMAAGKS